MLAHLILFAFLARLAILLGIAILTSLFALWVLRYVERRKQRTLSALPLVPVKVTEVAEQAVTSATSVSTKENVSTSVRILFFSSDDSSQCHMYQKPALHRVAELREDVVTIVEIDAPSSPDMTERYHVLTVPTTVILDETGKAHAINYGFANAQKILGQVDEVVAQSVKA